MNPTTSTTDTTMAEAMRKAGHKTPEDRLKDAMKEAIADCDGDFEEAVRLLVIDLRNKPVMLLALFPDKAVETRAREMLRIEARELADRATVSEHTRARPGAAAGRQAAESGWTPQDIQTSGADDVHKASHAVPRRSGVEKMGSATASVGQRLWLKTFLVNGRPIGECTVAEAIGWAASRERDAQFVRLITSGLQNLDMVIGDFKTDADAAEAAKIAGIGE